MMAVQSLLVAMISSDGKRESTIDTERFEVSLGEALLKSKLLTPAQLAQAMWEKTDTGFSLAEICLEQDWIPIEELYHYVPTQLLRLGELLVLYGYLTIEQLQEALKEQRRTQQKIGEILVSKSFLDREMVDWALAEQLFLRELAEPDAWQTIQDRLVRFESSYEEQSDSPFPVSSSEEETVKEGADLHIRSLEESLAAEQAKRTQLELEIQDLRQQVIQDDPFPPVLPDTAELAALENQLLLQQKQTEEERQKFSEELERLKQDNNRLQSQYESTEAQLQDHLRQLNNQQQREAELETEFQNQLQQAIQEMALERDRLLSLAEEEAQQVRDQITTLEFHLQDSRASLHILQKQVETLQKEVETLQEDPEKAQFAEAHIGQLSRWVVEVERRAERLQSDLYAREVIVQQLYDYQQWAQARIQQLEQALEQQEEYYTNLVQSSQSQLQEQSQSLAQQNQSQHHRIHQLESELVTYQDRIQSLESALQSLPLSLGEQHTRELATYQDQIQSLESALQSLPLSLGEQHAQELAQRHHHIQELETSLSEARKVLSEVTERESTERSLYQQQLSESAQHISDLQSQVHQLQHQLKSEQTRLKDEVPSVEAQEQLKFAEQRVEDLQIQLSQVSRQLQENLESAPRYQKLYEQQQTEIRNALTIKQRLNEDLAEQKRVQADMEHQFQAQRQLDQDRIHTLERELLEIKRERDSLTQQLQQSQKEDRLRELRDQITLLREQLNQERFQRSNLERELSKTKSSGSTQSEGSSFPKISTTTEKSTIPTLGGSLESSTDKELLELAAFGRATPWVQRVLTQLRAAGLLSIEDVDQILLNWEQDGGTFTNILSKFTGLRSETVKFFSEGGYSVRLAGARSVGDYLQASGLVTSSQIQLAQARVSAGKDLCQVLVEQGVLVQATADYFTATFNQQTSSQANKSKFSFRDRLS